MEMSVSLQWRAQNVRGMGWGGGGPYHWGGGGGWDPGSGLIYIYIYDYIYIYIAEASTNFSRQMNKNPSRLGEHDRNQVCLGFTFNHSVVHDFFQQKDQRLLGFSGISLYLFFKKKAAILDHHNCLEEQELLMEEIQLITTFTNETLSNLVNFPPVLNPPDISESSTGLRFGSNGPKHQSFSWILNEILGVRQGFLRKSNLNGS